MDLSKTKTNDTDSPTPDIRKSYCYVCNAHVFSERPKNWDEIAEQSKNRDYAPVTCGLPACLTKYDKLAEAWFPTLSAPHLTCETYDGGPFLEFAVRHNRPEVLNEPDPVTGFWVAAAYIGQNDHKLEPLFQEWLFFGLLQEFLGPQFCKQDFLDDEERLITTKRLRGILNSWASNNVAMHRVRQVDAVHLKTCISRTARYLQVTKFASAPFSSSFDKRLSLLLAVTGDMLERTLEKAFPEVSGRSFVIYGDQIGIERLLNLGWCPHEAWLAFADSYSLAVSTFYTGLERPSSAGLHTKCTQDKCYLLRSNPGKVTEPLHVLSDCSCKEQGPTTRQMQQIRDILGNGKIPVLRLEKELGTARVSEIVEASEKVLYVAISHVWTHGLGNSSHNRIYQCQIDRLYEHLKSLSAITNPEETGNTLHLWLDTLCCPIEPESARKQAIKLMRKTYLDSTHVLVLDEELQNHTFEQASVVEVSMRIFVSQWTRRLWTLQEGSLPQQIWIKFKDHMLNSHSMWLALRDIRQRPDAISDELALSTLNTYHSIRLLGGHYYNNHQGADYKYTMLGQALCTRFVTMPDDEAICIGTLMKLDMDELLTFSGEARMMKMWELISRQGVLTRNVLFYEGSKLSIQGYRWAPSTLLQRGSRTGLMKIKETAYPATASHQGLRFNSPGIIFRVQGCPPGLGVDKWDLKPDIGLGPGVLSQQPFPFVSLRNSDARWVYLIPMYILASNSSDGHFKSIREIDTFSAGEYALLQFQPGPLYQTNRDNSGLLVKIESTADNELFCVPLVRVGIGKHNPTYDRLLEAAVGIANDIRHQVIDDDQTPVEQVEQALSAGIDSALLKMDDVLREADRIVEEANSWTAEKTRAYIASCSSLNEDLASIGGSQSFKRLVQYAVAGRYSVVKEYVPDSQSWVVG